jgi:hypothetical protein
MEYLPSLLLPLILGVIRKELLDDLHDHPATLASSQQWLLREMLVHLDYQVSM